MANSAEAITHEAYRLAVMSHFRVDSVYFFVDLIDEKTANTIATFRHLDRIAIYAGLADITPEQATQEIESGVVQLEAARNVSIKE